jgi:hypothetical protein
VAARRLRVSRFLRLRFEGAGAGLGSARPSVAVIFAKQRSNEDDGRKHHKLKDPRDDGDSLCAAVPVHYVCDVKEGHATGLAGVRDGENGFQKPVEIDDANDAAFDLERLILGIPPAVEHARGKHGRLTGANLDRGAANDGAQHAGHDFAFLALDQVNMQRRAFSLRRNAAFEFEDDLIAMAHAAHDEDFAGMAVFQTEGAGCKTGSVNLP